MWQKMTENWVSFRLDNLDKKTRNLNFIVHSKSHRLCNFFSPRNKFFIYCFTDKNAIVMNVNIQTVHFDADGKLMKHVSAKLKKLNTFHDRIIKVDVFLKLDNVVHNIKDKIAEIRVHVPRKRFFVKASSKS